MCVCGGEGGEEREKGGNLASNADLVWLHHQQTKALDRIAYLTFLRPLAFPAAERKHKRKQGLVD